MDERYQRKRYEKQKIKNLENRVNKEWIRTKWEFEMMSGARIFYSYIITIVAVLLIILGVFQLLLSLISYIRLKSYEKLIETHYSTAQLPTYLLISGISVIALNLFICYKTNFYRFAEEKENGPEIRRIGNCLLIIYWLSLLIIIVSIFLTFWSMSSVNQLEKVIPKSFDHQMTRYLKEESIKQEIDSIQTSLQCCGTNGPTDWTKVSLIGKRLKTIHWYFDKFNESKLKETHFANEEYFTKDVPYSCCDPKSDIPCLFLNIDNSLKIYGENVKPVDTLYTNGCSNEIQSSLETLVAVIKWDRFVELSLNFIALVLLDLCQQSIRSEYVMRASPPLVEFPVFTSVFISIILLIVWFLI